MFLVQLPFISCIWDVTKGMKLECLPGVETFKATGQFLGNLKPIQVRHYLMYFQ